MLGPAALPRLNPAAIVSVGGRLHLRVPSDVAEHAPAVHQDGKPLKVQDQKHKDVKYQVIAREGYTAKHTVD